MRNGAEAILKSLTCLLDFSLDSYKTR